MLHTLLKYVAPGSHVHQGEIAGKIDPSAHMLQSTFWFSHIEFSYRPSTLGGSLCEVMPELKSIGLHVMG